MSCDKFSNMCKNNCDFTDPCNGSINCNNCGSMDPCDIGITCEVLNTEGSSSKVNKCHIKAPKFLATACIEGTIVYHIDIPEGFNNVQTISRNISITNCTLIKKKLLVEGFIISNLTYSTPAPINSEDNCVAFRNNCNNITVKIPFTFSMTVDSENLDDYINNSLIPQSNTIYPFNCESTGSLVEQSSTLNNLPYCELEGCEIAELGCNKEISTCNMEMLDDYYNSCPPLYGRFTQTLSVTLYVSILVRSNIKLDCKKTDKASSNKKCEIDCNVKFKNISECYPE